MQVTYPTLVIGPDEVGSRVDRDSLRKQFMIGPPNPYEGRWRRRSLLSALALLPAPVTRKATRSEQRQILIVGSLTLS